jgi:hypothetical protein
MLIVNAVIALEHQPPNIVLLQRSANLANTARDGRAGSPPAGAVDSAGSKTTLGEARPDLTGVGATGKSAVGIEDRVAGLHEVGVARLERHSFHHLQKLAAGVVCFPDAYVRFAWHRTCHLSRHHF